MWFSTDAPEARERPSRRSPVRIPNVGTGGAHKRESRPLTGLARMGPIASGERVRANRHLRSPTRRGPMTRGNTDGASASGHGLGFSLPARPLDHPARADGEI